MSNLREAAQQALEALKTYVSTYNDYWERGMEILQPMGEDAISKLEGALAQPKTGATCDHDKPVEAWHGDRKVTVYADTVLRAWGPNIETQMSTAPRTAQEVQDAFVWLYTDDQAQPVAWPTLAVAIGDPRFHVARGIMGTENMGQDEALRRAILSVLDPSPVAGPPQPPAERGVELSDSELYKMACLSLGNVPAARYRKDLLGLMREAIAADRAARGARP